MAVPIRAHLQSVTALDRVGAVAEAQDRLDHAASAYEESLTISRRLLREFGDTPQAIRDLAVSLERLGDVLPSPDAQARFQEALLVARRLNLVFQHDARGKEARESIRRLESKLNRPGSAA